MSLSAGRGFASDNNAGVHQEIFEALARVNQGHVPAYGADEVTARAVDRLRQHLGEEIEAYFVFNGSAANVLGLKAATEPHHSILCAETAHVQVDECGAPERFTGCKLLPVAAPDGKLRIERLERHIERIGDPHHSQPRVVTLSQPTEYGTVYSIDELRALAAFTRHNGLILHMDGARLANAAASLGLSLRALTAEAGVDVLSLGGTKNGMMFGEAVVFFDRALARGFAYIRKQGMQLASKMRFIAAQFDALLRGDLWLRNARHANAMAARLAEGIAGIPGVRITQRVQANSVFAVLPQPAIAALQARFRFYVWDEAASEVRWMTAWDTTAEDVQAFVEAIGAALRAT
jgi:threonine aldolase